MAYFPLCLAWNWEYDTGFVRLLEQACQSQGMPLLQITPVNLDACLDELNAGSLSFGAFYDRASDSDERFQPLVQWAERHGCCCINPQRQARWAWDKATMHLEFISRGLLAPYTILLPPYGESPELQDVDLGLLGGMFTIKPAMGGGGWGVVLKATGAEQVQAARGEYPHEKMLLQAYIEPALLEGHRAWFRVLVCIGAVYPCWWDTDTHVYTRLGADESSRLGLGDLRQLARRIERLCGLDVFSTEIARTAGRDLVVMDYVNDPIDLRLQSEAVDGVPDAIVENIAGRLARLAARCATCR